MSTGSTDYEFDATPRNFSEINVADSIDGSLHKQIHTSFPLSSAATSLCCPLFVLTSSQFTCESFMDSWSIKGKVGTATLSVFTGAAVGVVALIAGLVTRGGQRVCSSDPEAAGGGDPGVDVAAETSVMGSEEEVEEERDEEERVGRGDSSMLAEASSGVSSSTRRESLAWASLRSSVAWLVSAPSDASGHQPRARASLRSSAASLTGICLSIGVGVVGANVLYVVAKTVGWSKIARCLASATN